MAMHKTDVLLIGGGIMSKTLAMLVTQLDPSRHITLVEQASKLATESTDAWNSRRISISSAIFLNGYHRKW